MSKPQNISTFEELEERKRELELEVKVSQRELAHSLGTSKVNLNNFLLKRVALPIGGAIASLYLISKITKRKNGTTHEYHEKTIVKEVPSGDPAKYHYPVPPPEPMDDGDRPRQVTQSAPYQRRAGGDTPPPPAKRNKKALSSDEKKGLINMATIASVAKIAVPAVKMIISAVKDHQNKKLEANTDGIPNI